MERKGFMDGRNELKHQITALDCQILRSKLVHLMRYDEHVGAHNRYTIRSLYFDNSSDKAMMEKLNGTDYRAKFRIRLYNRNQDDIHLEKKMKTKNLCYKEACPVTSLEVERIRQGDIAWMGGDERKLIRELYIQMNLYQLRPKVVVVYEREPFVYPYGNVRVTFDSDVRTSVTGTDLLNFDAPLVPAIQYGFVLLEIKFDEYLPEVIKGVLQLDARRTQAFSKYVQSRVFG